MIVDSRMDTTLRILALALLTCFAAVGAEEQPASSAPSTEQLDKWASELGADDFNVREEAQKNLAAAGQAAVPALKKAAKSKDPEMRVRAERLLAPLTRGDRLVEAAQKLGSTDWEVVSKAIDVLLERCDEKSERAVADVAEGSGRTAVMAQVLRDQLTRVRKADDELARMVELGKTNPAVKQVVERKMHEVRRVYRERAYERCLRKFEELEEAAQAK